MAEQQQGVYDLIILAAEDVYYYRIPKAYQLTSHLIYSILSGCYQVNDHVFNHNMIINQKSVFDLVTRGRPESFSLLIFIFWVPTITIVTSIKALEDINYWYNKIG